MNGFGRIFRVSLFGESHGPAVGVVLDGVPAGIPVSEDDFNADIDRRRSGAKGTTPRRETDMPVIVSGVHRGHTTGAPLTMIFRNENADSGDYDRFRDVPRPGHADRSAGIKWHGFNDPRGGGHLSGRLTLPLVAAGVVAKKILCRAAESLSGKPSVSFDAVLTEIGGIPCTYDPATGLSGQAAAALEAAIKDGDSLGGIVECRIGGVPAGLGEPLFDSVESLVSHIMFSIPGVRGVEFGDGFAAAAMRGSQHNDPFSSDGTLLKNGAGGVNGGISNGAPIVFRVAFKPSSSIRKTQITADFSSGEMAELSVTGRHDACFALRVPVIVEAAAAIVLADLVAAGACSTAEK